MRTTTEPALCARTLGERLDHAVHGLVLFGGGLFPGLGVTRAVAPAI